MNAYRSIISTPDGSTILDLADVVVLSSHELVEQRSNHMIWQFNILLRSLAATSSITYSALDRKEAEEFWKQLVDQWKRFTDYRNDGLITIPNK